MSTCEHDRQDDVCWECQDERIADLERKLAEAQATVAHQARREIAEIASGHWPNVEQPIFDPITVLHAFRGKLWKERDALKATLAQARGLLDTVSRYFYRDLGVERQCQFCRWLNGVHQEWCPIPTLEKHLAALAAGKEFRLTASGREKHIADLERRLGQARQALGKAAATFGDLQQASDILGRTLVAESCSIAKKAILDTLAALNAGEAVCVPNNQPLVDLA